MASKPMPINEESRTGIDARLLTHVVGAGRIGHRSDSVRLVNGATSATHYSNAQLDDYHGLERRSFPWRPPLALTVRARFSHSASELRGTAGFGFWNDPFGMSGRRWPTLPRAIWFFFNSPQAPMKLALETPGYGWRAATIDGWRVPFLLLAPTAPLAWPLMRWQWLYQRIWPLAQWAIGVREAMVDVDLTAWHTYELHWGCTDAAFYVDGERVLTTRRSPRGPLGMVLWLDNQGVILRPGKFPRPLLLATGHEQWLEVAKAEVTI